jgi:hypothetical protein
MKTPIGVASNFITSATLTIQQEIFFVSVTTAKTNQENTSSEIDVAANATITTSTPVK